MSIKIDQYDKELRSSTRSGKMLASIISRKWGMKLLHASMGMLKGKNIKGLDCATQYIPSRNGGPDIRVRIFKPINADKKLPGFLYLHGGGYSMGRPEIALGWIEQIIKTRPCVVVAVDYRKSLKHPFPAGFNDCYDSLCWMKDHADDLGIMGDSFIVAGHSAGGGLTAALTLKARDTKEVNIAFQMPIYGMIDDRQESESARTMTNVPAWNSKTNALGWKLYLRDLHKQNQPIPAYAAPSRNKDYSNFPPTITFVGELDPFKDETLAYVEALKAANIPVKFELIKGGYHGFENLAPKTNIGRRAYQFQYDAYAEYYDTYIQQVAQNV